MEDSGDHKADYRALKSCPYRGRKDLSSSMQFIERQLLLYRRRKQNSDVRLEHKPLSGKFWCLPLPSYRAYWRQKG